MYCARGLIKCSTSQKEVCFYYHLLDKCDSPVSSVCVCAHLCLAAQVYAVEASSMAEYTRQLVRQNGCEKVITVLQGRAEEIRLAEKVDVLVSEWMGNCLLVRAVLQYQLLPL